MKQNQRKKKEKRVRGDKKQDRRTKRNEDPDRSTALFGYYFVAAIDVLGQKRALQQFKDLPSTIEEKNDFVRVAKHTFGVVEGIRQSFKSFYGVYSNTKRDFNVDLTAEQEKHYRRMRRCGKLIFHGFSDTFFTFVPLGSETYFEATAAINGVTAGLKACSATMLHALAAGHALRGGIEAGLGAELRDGDIYGPGLSNAHYLESKIAQYPRIVIGNELVDYLNDLASTEEHIIDDVYLRGMANLCLEFIADDGDCLILDYMGEGVRRMVGNHNRLLEDMRNNLIPKVGAALNNAKEHFEAAGDEKLAERYKRACAYYSSREGLWTT